MFNIGQEVTVRNDRGACYRGIVKSVLPNGNIMMKVYSILLCGRLTEGTWYTYAKPEVQVITGPTLEDTHGE